MKYTFLLLLVSAIALVGSGCQDNIFGPNKGTLSGFVQDNNGQYIEGATVTANYMVNDEEKSLSISTDESGYYVIEDVALTENEVLVNAFGFRAEAQFISLSQDNDNATLNFSLDGAPSYVSHSLSREVIYQGDTLGNDTVGVSVVVRDLYNTVESVIYGANLLLLDGDENVLGIKKVDLSGYSSTSYIFSATLQAGKYPKGLYSLDLELSDPDGNVQLNKGIGTLEIR